MGIAHINSWEFMTNLFSFFLEFKHTTYLLDIQQNLYETFLNTTMGTRFFYKKAKSFHDPTIEKLARKFERTLVITDDVETYFDSPPESSDREVSPKLIVGAKKYGRRSKPASQDCQNSEDLSLSDSEENNSNAEKNVTSKQLNGMHNHLVQRCSSQTDLPAARRRRTPTSNGHKLKRCSSLPGHRNANRGNSNGNGSVAKLQLQAEKSQLESSVESLDTPAPLESLSSHSIIEIWERAHIPNARNLLLSLGFENQDEVNLAQLNKILEEDLRDLEDDAQTALLRAAMALQNAELSVLKQTFRQLHDENTKLKADNKDANRRAALLAVEIDERHASLEDSTKKELKVLEQRHAALVRDLTARMNNDRENWTNLTTRLETRLQQFEQDEIKMKTELELTRKENSELELEQQKLQKQITDLLEMNIKLNQEIAALEDSSEQTDNYKSLEIAKEPAPAANSSQFTADDAEMLRLLQKVSGLQKDNTNLRDKNDELVAELENLNVEMSRLRSKLQRKAKTSCSENQSDSDAVDCTPTIERSLNISLASCETSGELVTLNAELQQTQKINQEANAQIDKLKSQVKQMQSELEAMRSTAANASSTQELEQSLEQMQKAYEECEDYWQNKLNEERQLFEKERQIYEEEQQESDKKFTELMEKVREYEEQFSKDGRLTPIEERDALEQQYADLEAEVEEVRNKATQLLEEKAEQVQQLQHEIEDLRLRLGESVEILTGAQELNEEASRRSNNQDNSPASSPINYLWQQSTIQQPLHAIQTPPRSPRKLNSNNLSTSETAIFSTTPMDSSASTTMPSTSNVSPIQKPISNISPVAATSKLVSDQQEPTEQPEQAMSEVNECETSSNVSAHSFDTRSVASTTTISVHNATQNAAAIAAEVQRNSNSNTKTTTATTSSVDAASCTSSPSSIKEELKRLKFFEISLKEQIQDLSLQRDGLVMELQQLQEAKPVLQKAYARTAHPSLTQRVNQLELKNRHLQNVIKQQQQYTESIMQQAWRQHQMELTELRSRIETQGVVINEQSHRLQNADILVKDLYVENSHLTASVQRLEQQRVRANLLQQQRLSGVPGMP